MSEDLPRFLERILRIPSKDANKYVDHLIDLGYDDVQAFIEDLTPEEVQFMKPGHYKRAEFFLNRFVILVVYTLHFVTFHHFGIALSLSMCMLLTFSCTNM